MTHGVVKKKSENEEVVESIAPDGGWGWMVVAASFMVHIFTDGMTYCFGLFYDELLDYFEEGKGYTALIASILAGMTLCSGPVSSSLVNRYGCQAVTIGGTILAAICLMISAFAQNVITLIITIGFGTGLGFGLIYLPAIVSVTVWFDKYRSLATGIAVCGSGLGTTVFSPITNSLINEYGWRGALAITGALVLNCVIFGAMFKPVPPRAANEIEQPMLTIQPSSPLHRSKSSEHVENGDVNGANGEAWRLTLSQPALNGHHHEPIKRVGSGVMLRPDVLYRGSITSLSRQRSMSQATFHSRTHSRIHSDAELAIPESCPWLPCGLEAKLALSEMLDFSLCKDPVFIVYALSNFLTSIGFYVPYVYLVPYSISLGIDKTWSSYCLSVLGVANCIGRIVLGYLSDKPWVNRLLVYNMCLTLSGIGTMLLAVCSEFWGLSISTAIFGFFIGAYVGLTSVVLVDLLGLEKLTNAFGLLLLFQGFASLLGPPAAGWLTDSIGTYVHGFYLAGGAISISGLMLFVIPYIQRRQHKVNDICFNDI